MNDHQIFNVRSRDSNSEEDKSLKQASKGLTSYSGEGSMHNSSLPDDVINAQVKSTGNKSPKAMIKLNTGKFESESRGRNQIDIRSPTKTPLFGIHKLNVPFSTGRRMSSATPTNSNFSFLSKVHSRGQASKASVNKNSSVKR